MKRLSIVLMVSILTACAAAPPKPASSDVAQAATPIETPHPPAAAIASAHADATAAGFEILDAGGNAFDAAIAVSAVLSVVEPISSGIGGGGFVLVHRASDGRDAFIDARETAPASAHPARYLDADGNLDRDRSVNGPWSAGIPGQPAAWVHLSEKYGRLPLLRSLAPAIRIAENGFPVYPRLESGYARRADVMQRYPGTRAVFLADGDPPQVGERLKQPDLAHTLRLLGEQGFDGFYRGDIAQKLIDGVNREGGEWTAEDLAGYRVREREPLRFRYRDWDVITAPPPSSGGVALAEILNMVSAWNLAELPRAERVHLLVEAMRRAYRDRTIYLGDPDFVSMPLARLTSRDYAAGLRATIHPGRATPSDLLPGQPAPLEDEETTHFVVMDKEGNVVSSTQTVNLLYGSGLIPEGTGVLLNDEMDDFALKPGTPNAFGVMGFEANAVAPGRRMLSSMSPTFMRNGDSFMALGTPGGSRIITMVLLGMLGFDDGLDPQAVTALPRYHHQWLPDVILAESDALDADTIQALEAMGHTVVVREDSWGNMHALSWNRASGEVKAGSDPRHPEAKASVRSTGSAD
ncbi:MAG: gamma-glutamyltransferase [Xanthomonadales bacterium]|nr:gamma-glutamyltransferase [Xanthomonadales bacterium]